jgi:hypothetical protein
MEFLTREKSGRHTLYRVIYNDADKFLFGNPPGAMSGSRTAIKGEPKDCRQDERTSRKPEKTASQYIPLNGGINLEESSEENSSEEARLPARRLGKTRFSENPGGQMARLERSMSVGEIIGAEDWFDQIMDYLSDDSPNIRGQAIRLLNQIEDEGL